MMVDLTRLSRLAHLSASLKVAQRSLSRRFADLARANLSRIVLFICAACVMSTASAETPASRAPDPGCIWHPFRALGLELLVQDCKDVTAHYVLSVHRDWIEQHRPFDDRTFVSHQVMRVLTKPAGLPIEQAIMRFVSSTLPREARGHCAVTKLVNSPVKDTQKILLTLEPTGDYARKIEAQNGPRDFGCGEYGKDQQMTYFEYHPNESKTRFLFVVYGWDKPLFDEQNIKIVDSK